MSRLIFSLPQTNCMFRVCFFVASQLIHNLVFLFPYDGTLHKSECPSCELNNFCVLKTTESKAKIWQITLI